MMMDIIIPMRQCFMQLSDIDYMEKEFWMNSLDIKVSVVIPVYNAEKYIGECLESIISQSLQEIEIICVNDGSTDGSMDILEAFSKKNQKIRVFNQRNIGASSSRNRGLRAARGKYIYFMDCDDMLLPGALERLYGLAENNELDMLLFNVVVKYENEELKKKYHFDKFFAKIKKYEGVKNGQVMFCEMWENEEYDDCVWSRFVRKSFLESNKIIFYEETYYSDSIYSLLCHLKAQRTYYIAEKYYVYRIREQSMMTSKTSVYHLYSLVIVYNEIMRMLYTEKLERRTETAIGELLLATVTQIKNVNLELQKEHGDKFSIVWPNIGTNILATSMGIGNTIQIDGVGLTKLEKLIRYHDRVVLYGAGGIGEKVYRYVKKLGCLTKIQCFAVTRETQVQEMFLDIPIKRIDDCLSEGTLVVISANEENQMQMQGKMDELKFSNYYLVDSQLVNAIDFVTTSNVKY